MQNPLYFHGNQAVTMATRTVTMVTSAWMVTMGERKMAESKMAENFEILKFFPNFFIKANFEILSTDLDTRPKISWRTIESLRGPGCSVTELLGF